jgi:hypothetical protein
MAWTIAFCDMSLIHNKCYLNPSACLLLLQSYGGHKMHLYNVRVRETGIHGLMLSHVYSSCFKKFHLSVLNNVIKPYSYIMLKHILFVYTRISHNVFQTWLQRYTEWLYARWRDIQTHSYVSRRWLCTCYIFYETNNRPIHVYDLSGN